MVRGLFSVFVAVLCTDEMVGRPSPPPPPALTLDDALPTEGVRIDRTEPTKHNIGKERSESHYIIGFKYLKLPHVVPGM